ncbi:MAG: hypothetical protein U1C57_01470 [Candidatus Doudnabacteria bacterium]|nr:hypothetical protein [bacterium]MDZ4243752.1 hypothetical protein [Candidatus Doudnabacteria bacterium]
MVKLVLSNTTTFFSGRIESVFKKAKKNGFKYVEIIPYRWTTAQEVSNLEKKYGVQVAGIHMPQYWLRNPKSSIFNLVFGFYLGGAANSPGFAITKSLSNRRPYLLFHANVADEMGDKSREISHQFHTLVENIPYRTNYPENYWNPVVSKESGFVFDPGHYKETPTDIPHPDMLEVYEKTLPEVVHISYNTWFQHVLPDKKEQDELRRCFSIHRPRYLVLETNPLVSVKKGKAMLEKLIR